MMPGEPARRRVPDLDVESLLGVIDEVSDPRVRGAALDLLEAVLGVHRAGLARILELVQAHPAAGGLLRRLTDDPIVASLLASHDLAPGDLEGRVRSALEKVRPYMHGHGGDIELVEVRDGRVTLRLEGACHGCGFSENTLRLGVERTLRSDLPEIGEIVVIGAPTPVEAGVPASAAAGQGWEGVARLDELPEGTVRVARTPRAPVLLCAAYGRVYAFRDACPDGGGSLERGTLVAFILKCPCHGHAFDVRSGRGLSRQDLSLEPLPSAWEDGRLRVAV